MSLQRGVGVLGASSLVGLRLLPLLADADWQVLAFSRQTVESGSGVAWRRLALAEHPSPLPAPQWVEGVTPYWICVAPIWVLPDYFSMLESAGVQRVVVLSSTSRFTKVGSDKATALQGGRAKNALRAVADGNTAANAADNTIAAKLIAAEERVQAWAASRGVEWVILRPTLIYGYGRDKNIAEIARLIRRFGFFPLLGKAQGLRQPVHAADVAAACCAALLSPVAVNHAYHLSGGETLAYRAMVERVFTAMHRRARFVTIPLGVFRLAIACLRCLPRYRQWTTTMAERMNQDMVFDHSAATRDLGFSPRGFQPSGVD